MMTVTVSSTYRVVIPKEAREAMKVKPGEELGVLMNGRTMTLVRIPTLDELQGCLRGADISGWRDEEDRF